MSMKTGDAGSHLVTHLFMLVVVHARPCFEGGDFESCFLSKASLNDDEIFPDIKEQFTKTVEPKRERQKYDFTPRKREMRGILEEFLKNCTSCEEETEGVDREDHFTQYLAEFLVNTDSEITSIEARDVEDIKDSGSSGKDDGYFAFITGGEKEFEVEGVWSHPARTIVEEGEYNR